MSVFLTRPQSTWLASNPLAFAIADAFAVSPGHTLVIPRRIVTTWFDATRDEQHALMDLVDEVKALLDAQYHPDGYNIGINAGAAAGQTVMHLHIHVIPRYIGDVPDPRGGVRHVIPGKGNYLAAAPDPLATGGNDNAFLHHIRPLFAQATDIAILAAFAQHKGVLELEPMIFAAVDRGARVRLVTGDYLHITQHAALQAMLGWMAREDPPRVEVRVIETAKLDTSSKSFHPKSWIFALPGAGTAFVGSSNISRAALRDAVEWNLRVDRSRDAVAYDRVLSAFEGCWNQARLLDSEFLNGYVDRILTSDTLPTGEVDAEPLDPPPTPHPIQQQALDALLAAREAGRQRALVVMATGLGKTWLAAFDIKVLSEELGRTPRVLFIAHRSELLRQAAHTMARQFPDADQGFFAGAQDSLNATFVFASVQKLALNLPRLAGQTFDYAVIDEAHHSEADSYRRVLDVLRAGFVLGLTATPDRTDQADILALFDDHLAYRADIAVGIDSGRLSPFHYHGLKDPTDYRQIPWRGGRFDVTELANAVQTQARMEKAWEGWQEHPGRQTLVFCCTIAHARFVCEWLDARGVRVEAVHSEADSADASDALAKLATGKLDAVCAVDLLSEGIDVPSVDRVVMLRPSESPIVFLQQLGRGLRRAPDKAALTILDFVGNHRVFLNRLRTLLDMAPEGAERTSLAGWLAQSARREGAALPTGCSVNLELEAIDLLKEMLPRGEKNALVQTFRELVSTRETRPTAGELYRLGLNPRVQGGWFAFVQEEGQLRPDEVDALKHAGAFLEDLERTPMSKCFKMVTLQVLIDADALAGGLPLNDLADRAHAMLVRSPELLRDIEGVKALGNAREPDAQTWRQYWRTNPVAAWLGESAEKRKKSWFALEDDRFVPRFQVPEGARPALLRMVAELVDWRLAEYRARARSSTLVEATAFECKVNHNGSGPILMLPDRAMAPGVPMDETSVQLPDGRVWNFRFVKIACNVAGVAGESDNRLPELLRGWFGSLAGMSGTRHRVRFRPTPDGWRIEPVALGDAQVISFPGRAHLPAFTSLRAAAGWDGKAVNADELASDDAVALPGAFPPGCFAVRASGTSMAGWRSEISDGDWLVCQPLHDVGFEAVVGQIVLVARGPAEARSFHVKRVARDGEAWALRSDNPDVPAITVTADDAVVATVRRVVRPEDLGPAVGAELEPGRVTDAFGLSREPTGSTDRVDGHLFLMADRLDAYDQVRVAVPDRRPGETVFVLVRTPNGGVHYCGVGRWDEASAAWAIPEVDFETWRALGHGRSASRRLDDRWLTEAQALVERLVSLPSDGRWLGRDGKRCRVLGRSAEGGVRIDGGADGFAARTISLQDLGWALAAVAGGGAPDVRRVNQLRYLVGTPEGSTRWIDTGWALHLSLAAKNASAT